MTIDSSKSELDPENPGWHLLPVRRGMTPRFLELWRLCEQYAAMIIGGYVRYMVSPLEAPAKAEDIDVFMYASASDTDETIMRRFTDLAGELGGLYGDSWEGPISLVFREDGYPTVNLIKPRNHGEFLTFGSMVEVLQHFDFTVVRVGLKTLDYAVADPDFLYDEREKRLVIKSVVCPLSGAFRLIKYGIKGYTVGPKEMIKLFVDWENRPQEYRNELFRALSVEEPSQEEIDHLEELLRVD